jgi:transposase-like protein
VFFLVCDGLKGLPEVVGNVWPLTTVQTCIIHLIRNTFRLASKRDWDALKRDVRPIYTAVNAAAARAALDELAGTWGQRYGAIVRLWENAWAEFIPFLDYDIEIRRVLCSTNAIESLNARYRRAIKARGHFPTEQAALKCLYLVTRSLDPTGTGQTRWTMRWLSRHGARCWHCCRSVSPCRSPNPACASRRTGLSTVSAVRRGSPWPRGLESRPGSGNG